MAQSGAARRKARRLSRKIAKACRTSMRSVTYCEGELDKPPRLIWENAPYDRGRRIRIDKWGRQRERVIRINGKFVLQFARLETEADIIMRGSGWNPDKCGVHAHEPEPAMRNIVRDLVWASKHGDWPAWAIPKVHKIGE